MIGSLPLVRIRFREATIYRANLFFGLISPLVIIFVVRALWTALYAGSPSHNGIPIEVTLTYAVITRAIYPLFPNSLISYLNGRVRSGNIIFDISRPISLPTQLFALELGRSLAALLTRSIPLVIFAAIISDFSLASTVFPITVFALTLCGGFIISYQVDFAFALVAFWVTNAGGLRFLKWSMSDILSGAYIPLWFFPPAFVGVVRLLPFRAVFFTPISILVGETQRSDYLGEILHQVIWIVILGVATAVLYRALVQRLQVQGG